MSLLSFQHIIVIVISILILALCAAIILVRRYIAKLNYKACLPFTLHINKLISENWPNKTLEELSEIIGIPQAVVSCIIIRHCFDKQKLELSVQDLEAAAHKVELAILGPYYGFNRNKSIGGRRDRAKRKKENL